MITWIKNKAYIDSKLFGKYDITQPDKKVKPEYYGIIEGQVSKTFYSLNDVKNWIEAKAK